MLSCPHQGDLDAAAEIAWRVPPPPARDRKRKSQGGSGRIREMSETVRMLKFRFGSLLALANRSHQRSERGVVVGHLAPHIAHVGWGDMLRLWFDIVKPKAPRAVATPRRRARVPC